MLLLNEVHTYYGNSHVLQGVSLKVPRGSVVALLGRNGMGKTTAVHTIIGIVPPRSGRIVFKGTEIAGREPHEIAQMGMALVPQGRRIFSSLTVRENLILGWRKGGKEGLNQALERVFTWFPNLKNRAKSRGGSLSGGEQQMLAIGRAMISNPEFLLMDEPSEGLAPAIIEYLIEKIDEMKASGLSILLVEQNLRAALRLADHLYIMNKGRTKYIGKAGMSLTEEEVKEYFLLDNL